MKLLDLVMLALLLAGIVVGVWMLISVIGSSQAP